MSANSLPWPGAVDDRPATRTHKGLMSRQDKAKLDNKTDRSLDSQIQFGLNWLIDVAGWHD